MAPDTPQFWQPVKDSAPSFDVSPSDVAEVEHANAKFAGDRNGGLMVLLDVSATYHRDLIIALAARHRLPAVYPRTPVAGHRMDRN